MLRTVPVTANRKTGPIAVTYRSGTHETYGTCPKSCALHPKNETGADSIDAEYLAALRQAVPRNGQAWTYSHFPAELLPVPAAGETVINASCDTMADALAAAAIFAVLCVVVVFIKDRAPARRTALRWSTT
jgi:hypothetical protein